MRNVFHLAFRISVTRTSLQGAFSRDVLSPAKLISTTTTTRDNRSYDRFSVVKPGENDETGVVCQKRRRRRRRERSVECNTSTPFAASRYDVSGSGNDAGIRENAFRASRKRLAEDGAKRLISSLLYRRQAKCAPQEIAIATAAAHLLRSFLLM